MIFLFLVALLTEGVAGQQGGGNCTGLPTGCYYAGCASYTRCVDGKGTIVDCEGDKVFDNDKEPCGCYPIDEVGFPCGQERDCSGQADGRYADLVMSCTGFYTCLNEQFVGYNPCSPGLVFNEKLSVCDWPENVKPPCGIANMTVNFDDDDEIDCAELPDGSYNIDCVSYMRCEGGNGTVIRCDEEDVFNEDIGKCDNIQNVEHPCGLKRDCTDNDDGTYADLLTNCTHFYTCAGNLFMGTQPCNAVPCEDPLDDYCLVYDEETERCDIREYVPPPCGSADPNQPFYVQWWHTIKKALHFK